MTLRNVIEIHGGGAGSGPKAPCPQCGPGEKKGGRIAQMNEKTWVSKSGKRVNVYKMEDHHLTSVLRMLHEQLALARGREKETGERVIYQRQAEGPSGEVIARAIPPYRAMVKEAKKRKLHW